MTLGGTGIHFSNTKKKHLSEKSKLKFSELKRV